MTLELAMAAFLVGLAGGGHCLAMCGGIITAMTSIPGERSPAARHPASARGPSGTVQLAPRVAPGLVTGYHLGRVLSYASAGLIAGTLGSTALLAKHLLPVQQALYVLASLMLVVLGLYVAGAARLVAPIERAGALLWRHIAPFVARFAPARGPGDAIVLGALWGWVPCGMVYGVLAMAAMTGSGPQGAVVMVAFGLGTLPNVLAAGWLSARLRGWQRSAWARRVAGIAIVAFGAIGLAHVVHG